MINRKTLLFIMILTLITNLSIVMDINFLREVSVFIFLSIVPGILVLELLNIKSLYISERVVFIVGLSIAITMFLALTINSVFSLIYTKPLTVYRLLIPFDVTIALLLIINIFTNKQNSVSFSSSDIFEKYTAYDKFSLILSVIILFLSILGTNLQFRTYNPILIGLMLIIMVLIIYTVLFNKKINDITFPLTIFSISLSLLLTFNMISPYIYGSDSSGELYFFKMVLYHSKWAVFENSVLDSAISISLLPAVYQILSQLGITYAFKFFFILPLSLTPLIMYLISKRYVKNNVYAFLASMFIISQASFFAQISAYRTGLSVFFFALTILVLIKNELNYKWKILLITFLISAAISHYSSGYIILGILVLSFIFTKLIPKVSGLLKTNNQDVKFRKNIPENPSYITVGIIVLLFVFIFFWNAMITGQSFNSGLDILTQSFKNLCNFFNLDTRDQIIFQAAGSTLKNAPLSRYINFLTYWTSIIFILFGVLIFLKDYIKNKVDDLNFMSLSLASITLFGSMMIMPNIMASYSVGRAYYLMLAILSTFFIIGGVRLTNFLRIKKSYLVILLVVILTFSTSSGIISQLNGSPNSVLLNSPKFIEDNLYIQEEEAYSAEWFKNYRINGNVYADTYGSYKLISISIIPYSKISRTSLIKKGNYIEEGYLYLDYSNIVKNKYYIYTTKWNIYQISQLKNKYEQKNLVYDNGASEIWY